jgi:hypothetical protein
MMARKMHDNLLYVCMYYEKSIYNNNIHDAMMMMTLLIISRYDEANTFLSNVWHNYPKQQ